jgi:subtilisin family serine protease
MVFKKLIFSFLMIFFSTFQVQAQEKEFLKKINETYKLSLQLQQAWSIEEGRPNIVVAIIDTGLDLNHINFHSHQKQTKLQEVDGWDFTTQTPYVRDENGHGTHIAGIISSIAPNITLMPLKYYSPSLSEGNLDRTVEAIEYAIDHHARIINYSGGGLTFSAKEQKAILRAEQEGILFVAAAGNEHKNLDLEENSYYPASYHLSNIISVAASDRNNELLKSSDWGKHQVDIVAPGDSVYSSLPGNRYGFLSGTSQATAWVTGAASLLLSHDPSLTPQKIKAILMSSADPFPQFQDKVRSSGRLNPYHALLSLGSESKKPKTKLNLSL